MRPKLTPYGLDALHRGMQQAPEVAQRELLAATWEAVKLLESDVVGSFPRASGVTRASVTGDAFAAPLGTVGLVGSANPVVAFVVLGTKPHTPPLEPLLLWVQQVLGKTGEEGFIAARGIQRKIRARGTPAQPIFQMALERHRAAINRMFEAAGGRVAAALQGGKA